MSELRITKKMKFEMVMELVKGDEMLVEFITKEMEMLDRKNSKPAPDRKPTAAQLENEVLKEGILEELFGLDEAISVADFIKTSSVADGLTSPKVTAQLTKLVKEGRVAAEKVKGKNVYKAIEKEV